MSRQVGHSRFLEQVPKTSSTCGSPGATLVNVVMTSRTNNVARSIIIVLETAHEITKVVN